MATPDFTAAIAADSHRFRTLLAGADPDRRVPSCPDWSGDDLLWHLTETQWFWATIASDRLDEPGPAEAAKPPRPTTTTELVALAEQSTDRLLDALDGLGDDEPVWSWNGAGDGAFVRRRQAHEALVHRVDAEQVTGQPSDLDADLATDGVDEVLREMFGLVPPWAEFVPSDHRLVVVARDTSRAWSVTLGRFVGTSPRSDRAYDRPVLDVEDLVDHDTIGTDTTAVLGEAATLDLWLWSRAGEDDLDLGGDDATLDGLRAIVHDGIQ